MVDQDLKINFNPSSDELAEIKHFLFEEHRDFQQGFYYNWEFIESAYAGERIISFQCGDKCVGFIEWRDGDFVIYVDRFVISKEFRRRGFGKFFFRSVFESLKKKNSKVIVLYCEPHESQWFWKKMGFVQFPFIGHGKELTFFKNIFPIAELTENPDPLNMVELWNLQPIFAKDEKPKWIWNLDIEDSKLKVPILQACNTNWKIKITMSGEVIHDSKVNKLLEVCDQIFIGDFLYMERVQMFR